MGEKLIAYKKAENTYDPTEQLREKIIDILDAELWLDIQGSDENQEIYIRGKQEVADAILKLFK